MNILFISPLYIFPPYWGGGVRTYNLIKSLSRKHKVYYVSSFYRQFKEKRMDGHRKELEKQGVEVYTPRPLFKIEHPFTKNVNPEVILKSIELLMTKEIDVIICDYPWAGINTLLANSLFQKPIIFHEHNVEFIIKDEIRARYGRLMKLLESTLCKVSKKIVTVSKNDKEQLTKEFNIDQKKIHVIKNGFNEQKFFPNSKNNNKIREKYGIGDGPLILFDGKLDYPPNKEAVYKIRWEIMPKVLEKLPNAKFMVVGGGYKFDLKHEALIFTGLVDKIEEYINVADVVITPLLAGGGTRIKILEAIACGKTVISTSKGAEGLENDLTKLFLKIADDWEKFSDLVVEFVKNPKNKKVPKEFLERYSWQNIYKKFDTILKNLK